MIVEVEADITKVEQYTKTDGRYGRGSTQEFEESSIRGTWEFESHPNLDAYFFNVYGFDSLDLLLDKCGYNPDFEYEIDYKSVETTIYGSDEEWIEQAKEIHDGHIWESKGPRKALEKHNVEESDLSEARIDRIVFDYGLE